MKHLIYYTLIIFLAVACYNDEKEIPPPEIFLQMSDTGIDIDTDSVDYIEPKITYDINSEYSWIEGGNLVQTEKIYEFNKDALGTYNYIFSVKTPYGEDQMDITVNSLHINTFEETAEELNSDGYLNNPENGYHLFKEFIQYPVDFNEDDSSWSGFALSDNTNQSDASIDNEFSVYNSYGAEESDVFCVFKQSEAEHHILFDDGAAHAIKSISVNNSTMAYLTMVNGFNKKEDKDFLLLTITGYNNANAETGSVEFYLADYRPEEIVEKYIISEWNEIDLSDLGNVSSIEFKLSSSVDENSGFEMPLYFCLDNLKIRN